VRSNIPDDIPIIAVYLRVTDTPHGLEFNVAECAIDDGREGCRACTPWRRSGTGGCGCGVRVGELSKPETY
jgi:hypothetical protein